MDRAEASAVAESADRSQAIRRRSIVLVMSTAFCIGVTIGLFPSLLALNIESQGFDASWNGLLGAIPPIAGILVSPFAPAIIARWGALRTYLVVTAIAIVSACLFPVLPDLGAWFVIRFAMGVGMGIQWVVSEMWVNRLAMGPRRGLILSIYVIVLSAGLSIGPVILNLVGIQGSAPFLVTAAVLTLSCVPLLFATTAVTTGAREARSLPLHKAMLRKPSAMLAGMADGFVFQTLIVFLPVYFLRLGTSQTTALNFVTLVMVGGLILQVAVGYMLDKFAPERVLVACSALIIACLAMMALVVDMPVAAWTILLILGGASAALYTAGLAGINDSFSASDMPSGTATFSILWWIGGLTGPPAAGYAMEIWNPHGMVAILCAASAVLAVANILSWRGKLNRSARPEVEEERA